MWSSRNSFTIGPRGFYRFFSLFSAKQRTRVAQRKIKENMWDQSKTLPKEALLSGALPFHQKFLKSLLKAKLKRNLGKNVFTWKISNLLRCIGINARGRDLCTFTVENSSLLFAAVTQVSRKWECFYFQTVPTRENEGIKWLLLFGLTTWTVFKLTNLLCLLFFCAQRSALIFKYKAVESVIVGWFTI